MAGLFDSITVRVIAGLVAAIIFLMWRYSFDIWQFLTRRDFGNVNAYTVVFTRHEKDAEDLVVFELIGYKIPLREICRNRFLFWVIIYHSLWATVENPVLNFGKRRHVLVPVRGKLSEIWRSMVLKSAAGYPSRKTMYKLALVYDLAEDTTNYVLRIMLIRTEDIERFDEYLRDPPTNTRSFKFVEKIVEAYKNETGSFLNVRVTTA